MRIGAGALRGRRLEVSKGVRPTGGRAKEALLSRWQGSLPGCSFLDLFAGSGAVGLEALSRGAREVVLVEKAPRALRILGRNCDEVAPGRCAVLRGALPSLPAAARERAPFTHVFADPPYAFEDYEGLLVTVSEVLDPGGEAALEHSSKRVPPPAAAGLAQVASKEYGDSRLTFYRLDGS